MSLTQRLKQGFLRLPPMKKVVLVSSFTLCVSTVMPWYDQRNNFGVGDTYLGLQGPLFMIGAIMLLCGAVSFFNMFLPLLGRNFFDLKRKTGSVALLMGSQALLLLVVANSIFFHPAFAATVNNKMTRFGMAIAFFSVGAMMISGWWTRRKDRSGVEEEQVMEEFTEPIATPVQAPSYPVSEVPVQTNTYEQARPAAPSYGTPQSTVDPLTLDARTRYRLMKSQGRFSSTARNNLWGGGQGSAYGVRREEERDY